MVWALFSVMGPSNSNVAPNTINSVTQVSLIFTQQTYNLVNNHVHYCGLLLLE